MEEERRGKQEQYEGVLGLSEYIVRVCWDYLSILCHFHVTEWFLYNLQVFLSCLSQGVGLCTQVGAECTQVGVGQCTQVGAKCTQVGVGQCTQVGAECTQVGAECTQVGAECTQVGAGQCTQVGAGCVE